MAEGKSSFKLPQTTVKSLNDIIHAYALCNRGKVKVADVATKCGMDLTRVSRNHAFLMDIGILSSGQDKSLTDDGYQLGVAIGNNDNESGKWGDILRKNSLIQGIMDLFRVKGSVPVDDFPKKIASTLSQSIANASVRSGIIHLIELLDYSSIVIKNENMYILGENHKEKDEENEDQSASSVISIANAKSSIPPISQELAPQAQQVPTEKDSKLPNIHIDLQIHISPESTPDQIDKIFESIKKHLYS